MLTALLLAATTPPAVLEPTTPWTVRAEENLCLLERHFQANGQPVALIFQPLLDLPSMELFVVAPDPRDSQFVGAYTARVGGGAPVSGKYFSVRSPKSKLRITRLTIERALLDRLEDGDALTIEAKPVAQAFRIVRPAPARAALKGCIDSLKKAWGIDPNTEAAVATSIQGNPARYFGPDSYPHEALSQGINGRVVALLNIDVSGAVAACRILSSAGPALNDGTCKAAAKIRFTPPRDVNGKPLPTTYILPVRWVLPGTEG